MSNYLFLYGTLLPEHAPAELAPAIAKLRRLGGGTVRGHLYDFGEYPGAVLPQHANCGRVGDPVLDASALCEIHGSVFELPDDEELWRALDGYEGFDPKDPHASLFVRKLQPVALDNGKTVLCWIYVYNREPGGALRILSGRYRDI